MKLLSIEINGNFLELSTINLYHNIKSCVMFSNQQSYFFPSFRGVRQGENFSPVLFCIFVNDLQNFMLNHNVRELIYKCQKMKHVFLEYSETWKLNINFKKTKVLIFGIRSTHRFEFKL